MPAKTHKFAKGDTLDAIAKKYRSSASVIWKAPENKALASKRGKPELLQPGDVVTIPPDPKVVKATQQKVEQLRRGSDAARQLLDTLIREAARVQLRIKTYDGLIEYTKKSTLELATELNKTLADMKRYSDGVDTVATVAQITVSMAQICKKGMLASKLSGEALVKANKELGKELLAIPADQLVDLGIESAGDLKERANSPLGYVGVLADSWGKMTAPSFWANTFVQMTKNNKTWSEAVAMDVGEDIRDRIKEVLSNGNQQVQKLKQQLAEATAHKAETAKMIDECKARIRLCETEIAKVEAM